MSEFSGAVVIGFMGAGKSRIGRALASRMGWPFIDTDAVIVQEHGSIADIFARSGEAGFRSIEGEVVLETLNGGSAPIVLSLGGGAVTVPEVRAALLKCANVIWLDADLATLHARVSRSRERTATASLPDRPLAADRESFERLFEQRRGDYEAVATIRLKNDGTRSVEDLVYEAAAALRQRRQASG